VAKKKVTSKPGKKDDKRKPVVEKKKAGKKDRPAD